MGTKRRGVAEQIHEEDNNEKKVAKTTTGKISDVVTTVCHMRCGGWLPTSHRHFQGFMQNMHQKVNDNPDKPLLPVIQEFKELIEEDTELFLLFSLMFEEIPKKYQKDPAGHHQVRHYLQMLHMLNHILTEAPYFDPGTMVGTPITAILDYAMGTEVGFAAFINVKVNEQIKRILNQWAKFLGSPDSRYVLTKDKINGWFGEHACERMFHNKSTKFEDVFHCDPHAEYYGYKSWDDFFTRKFVDGARPLAYPEDDSVIANACESAPYRISYDVKKIDRFWIKGQPYSLQHMMAQNEYVDQFVGGTVYQAFLSAMNYHRWNAPVSGVIKKAYRVQGTYYSEPPACAYDDVAPCGSQGYLAEVATRAVIFIEADNKDIGLMCFIAIGMIEVSTCDITVYEGQHVNKGDETGMFHYGGSTHCLIFGPQVRLQFDLHGLTPSLENHEVIKVKERIATVLRPKHSAGRSSSDDVADNHKMADELKNDEF